MMNDMELIQKYARENSGEAFAMLVSRHVSLVYSVAFRQVHDIHLAEEISQTVFIILARKAGSLGPKTVVAGWLCKTARFTSSKALTIQNRRHRREQEAYMRSNLNEMESNVWKHIEPLLDMALASLGENDHNAIVLRYLEGQNFKNISTALGTTEAGAKMRVNRALEKLRKFFSQRGLTCSAALIAAAISANSIQAAPLGLAVSTTVAVTNGMTNTASTATLLKETLKIMTWTKLKTTIVLGGIAVLIAGTATAVYTIKEVKNSNWPSSPKYVGYATPESAVQSMLWAASNGESLTNLAEGVTPDQMELFEKRMAGKSSDEIKQSCIAWANSMAGYKITEKEVIADDEVHLHIHAIPSADGLHTGHTVLIMKKIDGAWKFAGNAS
jgi:RNA polymerase sigma factor (sigma-70 family)